MKNPNFFYWVIAIVLGSIINLGFFLFLPAIGKTTAPQKIQTIELEFLAWQKPAPQEILPPKAIKLKPKPAPAPTPVKKKIPKPPQIKPKIMPKPEPRPVLSEITVPEKIKPKEKISQKALQKSLKKARQSTNKITSTKTEDSEVQLPTPIPIFKLTTLPRMLHRETPTYPLTMKQEGKEATVKLSVLLDAKGLIRKISIIKSGGTDFDLAAINAIKKSTFMPANINGKPVAVLMKIPVKFRLR